MQLHGPRLYWNRALCSMSWLKTGPEREAQEESGGHQSPPTAGAAWRGAVPHHRRKSPTVEAWLHAGRVIFLGQLGSTAAAAKDLRLSLIHI